MDRENAPLIIKPGASSYRQTVLSLIEAIERRGLTVFARIDHSAGAHGVGLELAAEEVVLFGSPKSGTPLMQSDRRIGIELPLRVLVWQDGNDVRLGYRDPRELAGTYEVAAQQAILGQMATLLDELTVEAAGQPRV